VNADEQQALLYSEVLDWFDTHVDPPDLPAVYYEVQAALSALTGQAPRGSRRPW